MPLEEVVTLRQLLEALFSPLPAEVVKLLREEKDWEVGWSRRRRKIKVTTLDLAREQAVFLLPTRVNIPRFSAAKVGKTLGIGNDRLYVNKERAFFQGKPGKDLEETLALVRVLRPLFDVLGLSDLEGALEALAELRGEEVRQHGPYVLAWSGKPEDPLLLRRGTILGDFVLDGAFLLGRELVLQYPKAKVVLRGGIFSKIGLKLKKFELEWSEWGGGHVQFQGRVTCHALHENPMACLVREAVMELLAREPLARELLGRNPSRMNQELLRGLLEPEDLLEALKDEDFFRQVGLRLLSHF
jgi:hypothetical protein